MTEPVTGDGPEQTPAGTATDAPADAPRTAADAATSAPPLPAAPPVPPQANPWAAPALSTEPPRRRPSPRVRRAVGRWTAAVAVFGVFCAGTAYGITRAERHDLPGLATESDGRWEYPELELPALPSGSPRPFALGNEGHIHHADLRDLLLPVPEGAEKGLRLPSPDGGWVGIEDFAGLYNVWQREEMRQFLVDTSVRHIAARGWEMPDGTRTSIHLLRFNTDEIALDFYRDLIMGIPTRSYAPEAAGPDLGLDMDWRYKEVPENVGVTAYRDKTATGVPLRMAYLRAGDIVGVVLQQRRGTVPEIPFRQTMILQAQLLG
ncbi:hypothetical protein [Streptomyces taklimakanensis]|uniref:hypothetical protein n=1 Tax=Streptomyces taklimakanensis TaxID=2569853 RepID=UPI00192E733F|nr:hypothetical protein [Streptomyces taklimakanensis]